MLKMIIVILQENIIDIFIGPLFFRLDVLFLYLLSTYLYFGRLVS